METMLVSASKGVLSPLLVKLTTLMGNEFKKLKGVRKQVSFLKDELSIMDAFLEKLERMDEHELDPMVKNWRSNIREMVYDIEDCIDDFMYHLGDADSKKGFIKKTTRRLKTLWRRHQISHQIDELKARVLEASERRTRYKLDELICKSGSVAIDPRVKALYAETTKLVGIDGPREKLVKRLLDAEQQLKVMSIVGFGGLGKTTLAKEVYHSIKEHFECEAFVCVSQRPNIIRLLNGIQSKFGVVGSSGDCEVQEIIANIRGYLKHKRYLIVVDDLWSAETWDIMSCAFPENGKGSRVIVTTRKDDVASRACQHRHECIYRMEPLDRQDARRLFFKKIFGCEDGCPSQFEEVSTEILKRCSGLALAIISIASLLATRPERISQEWENIKNSIETQSSLNPTLEVMWQILELSYKDLPSPLKTCLLYLGLYPEDDVIKRDDLVRQWIAEGFVSNLHGPDLEDVGRSFFNEFVNRSLIQPESTEYGEVISCRVHDMMLDLILRRCAEENFSSVAYSSGEIASLHGRKVRRLSLDFRVGCASNDLLSGTTNTSLSQVRSLAWFGSLVIVSPLIFRHLRVLILKYHSAEHGSTCNLTAISQLFQLRYLNVTIKGRCKAVELPGEIQGLRYLQTLEIDCCTKVSIPLDVVRLPCLAHLILPSVITLGGIGNMKSLQSLKIFGITNTEDIKAIGELTSLRNLVLCFHRGLKATYSEIDALATSLGKLRDLRYLSVFDSLRFPIINDEENRLGSLNRPPRQIERLELRGWKLLGIPKWISSGLQNLCHLELLVLTTSTEEVRALGELPSLVHLMLYVEHGPSSGSIIFGKARSFPYLEYLVLSCGGDAMSYLCFEAAVMPKLQRLYLKVNNSEWGGTAPVGMEHLLSLREIDVNIHYGDSYLSENIKTTTVTRFFTNYAEQVHPSRPSILFWGTWNLSQEIADYLSRRDLDAES